MLAEVEADVLGIVVDPEADHQIDGLGDDEGGDRGVHERSPHRGELIDEQIGAAIVFSAVATFIIAKAIDLVWGLRVDEDAEDTGLDLSQHAETAYAA